MAECEERVLKGKNKECLQYFTSLPEFVLQYFINIL